LDAKHTAGLLADAFSGNSAVTKGEDLRRRKWAKSANAGFLPKPPGGWSAKGQPCDAFHAYFRLLTDQYEDQCLGYGHNLFRRPRPEDIPVSGCHIRKQLSIHQIIECNIWAWHQMPDAQFRPRHQIAEPCPRTRLARWMPSSWWWGVYIYICICMCIYIYIHGKFPYQPGLSTYLAML